jgi:hypothetical protein
MAAVFVHQGAGVAELDFQETRPSFQWPQEAWLPPTVAWRAAQQRNPEPDPVPAPHHPLQRYHDLTTAAWIDEDTGTAGADAALDAVDRQSWTLARLVCVTALAVAALGLACYLVG